MNATGIMWSQRWEGIGWNDDLAPVGFMPSAGARGRQAIR
jgi:hypothetical protein